MPEYLMLAAYNGHTLMGMYYLPDRSSVPTIVADFKSLAFPDCKFQVPTPIAQSIISDDRSLEIIADHLSGHDRDFTRFSIPGVTRISVPGRFVFIHQTLNRDGETWKPLTEHEG